MAKDQKGHGSNAKGGATAYDKSDPDRAKAYRANQKAPASFVKEMRAWAKSKGYSEDHIRYVTSGQSARDNAKSAPKTKKPGK